MEAASITSLKDNPASATAQDAVLRARADASVSRPVLFFFINSLLWLFFGTLFGAMVFYKLKDPTHLSRVLGFSLDFLHYGRIYPAFVHMWIYGWCFQASFGAVLWLLARLTRSELKQPLMLQVAALLWNLGVTMGVISILAGNNTGFDWLEFPAFSTIPMLLAFAGIAWCALDLLRRRRGEEMYISLWYVVAALFWFPSIYFAGNLLLNWFPVGGVLGSVVNAWVKQGILGLWFVPIGLSLAYYLIPKVVGRPIHSYHLAAFGFWMLALVSPWNSGAQLEGGPLPAWLITVGISAGILMLIPTWVVAFNFHKTLEGDYEKAGQSPTLKFVVFGLVAYVFGQIFLAVTGLRDVSSISQFTVFQYGQFHLMFYAFFSSILFGAIYFITPRLVGCEWVSSRLIKWHFLLTAYSVAVVVMMWCVSGFFHGAAVNSTLTTHLTGYRNVVESSLSLVAAPLPIVLLLWCLATLVMFLVGVWIRRLFYPILTVILFSWIVYTVVTLFDLVPMTALSVMVIPVWVLAFAQMLFLFHFMMMLFRLGRLTGGPTLLADHENGEGH
ncbi:MAG: cbb3-type cytochrome c oxidase subunit I [Candidatus Methylacidiphilales bacterium]